MIHLVQFSTGLGSAEVARRVVDRYGTDSVQLLTADTLVEDEDNWRFAHQVVDLLGLGDRWTVLSDGRTPMQVGRDERVVPNDRMAVCSKILKRRLLRRHIEANYDPTNTVIHMGFDWTEEHRHTAAVKPWLPYRIQSVLLDPPFVHKQLLIQQWTDRGIQPPRLYAQGFSHANCGGACVRGGQAAWRLLLQVNRDRYLDWEREEQVSRDQLGKDVAIMRDRRGGTSKPLTLHDFRIRIEGDAADFDSQDWGSCGCFMPDTSDDTPAP